MLVAAYYIIYYSYDRRHDIRGREIFNSISQREEILREREIR
jgi:hypothetical protein